MVAVAVNAVDEDIQNALGHAAKKASKAIDNGDMSAALADLEKSADKSADRVADDLSRPRSDSTARAAGLCPSGQDLATQASIDARPA